jgi:hypothetical protein
MMFAMVALDRPYAVPKRMEMRPEHLKHLDALGEQLILAGPFLNDNNEGVGTILVIEAENIEEAREMFNRDPYIKGNLFDQITIKPWALVRNNTR